MTYQVLARKWRPHNFTEIVGQEHVVKSLINALQHDRLHHAYLFTGTRGVGKTTIARILAKAVNCENLQDFNPCGECAICRDLDAGRFLDLIEVDAASRTKVEDTRDLLENAQYAPNQGRYKVYLIDEVHMLSGHSFNALLKTLEEPPSHVKFLLATTDPQKIPVTVLSRCLQFNLKRLSVQQISAQMQTILQQEQLEFEAEALRLLARAADGSMRDGLSLLDQAIVFGNGKVASEQVVAMLGTVARQPVEELLTVLAQGDAGALLEKIAEISELTANFSDVLEQLLQQLHRIALAQAAPQVIAQDEDAQHIREFAALLPAEDVQLYYQIGLKGQRDLTLAPDPRSGFEMVMLRMLSFRPVASETSAAPLRPSKHSLPDIAKSPEQSTPVPAAAVKPAATVKPVALTRRNNNWDEMIQAMKLRGMTRELANNCVLENIDEQSCTLIIDPGHKQLRSSRTEQKLQHALQDYCGRPLNLVIKDGDTGSDTPAVKLNKQREQQQQAAVSAIEEDENIQLLKDKFEARVVPGSIEPVK